MKFKRIRAKVIEQENKRLPKIDNQEDLNKELSHYGKEYKGDYETQRKKLLKLLIKRIEKAKEEALSFIQSVEEANDSLPNALIITVEWKKSYMWGMNPKAYTNYGFESESIGGCGYCKLSTATAEALNSQLTILKYLFKKEERRLKEQPTIPDRRNFIGYGSGYYALPKFEGGVGVGSHEDIINGMNLKWESITQTDTINVYRIADK